MDLIKNGTLKQFISRRKSNALPISEEEASVVMK